MPRVLPKFTVFVLFFFRFTKRILQKVSILQKPFYKRQSIALYFIFIFFRYSSNRPTKKIILQLSYNRLTKNRPTKKNHSIKSKGKFQFFYFFKQPSYKISVLQKKPSTKGKSQIGLFYFSSRLVHPFYKKIVLPKIVLQVLQKAKVDIDLFYFF